MNDEGIWKKAVVALPRRYSDICLEWLRKRTKTLIRIVGRDSNRAPPEYEPRPLPVCPALRSFIVAGHTEHSYCPTYYNFVPDFFLYRVS
jgi:hypothetical protein